MTEEERKLLMAIADVILTIKAPSSRPDLIDKIQKACIAAHAAKEAKDK